MLQHTLFNVELTKEVKNAFIYQDAILLYWKIEVCLQQRQGR